MSETPPPRRPLATFLRAAPAAPPLVPTPPAPSTEPADTAVPAPESAPVAAPLAAPVPAPVRPLPAPPRSPEAAPPDAAARAPDTLIAPTRRDAPLSASPLPLPATPPAPVPVPVPVHSSAQTADPAMRRSADDRPTAAAAIAPAVVATSTAPLAPAAAAHATNAPDQPAIAAQSAASAPGATVTQTPQASPPANQDGQPAPAAPQAAPEAEAGASTEAELEADPDDTATTSTSASASASASTSTSTSTSTPASPSSSPTPAPTLEPAFARRGLVRPRLRASGWQWAVLVGLVLLLGLQIVIADRARLAGDARWRPLVSAACAVARCALPPWRDPATLTLLTRDVRPLPAYPGVLQIQASFRNDARWAQAWPWLQLSLSDADGRVIGTRVCSPQDYLGQAPAAQDTLAPGQAVQVAFRVREPAASTAGFSFDFR
ncbi:DUF3426 domain-containing protein [Xanthomonas campestris]|uniref:DUF3426 domain-containing protein n=1 Tax=Xanthomonas campestris TaxID=339 RepID=UPI0023685853|nr:DUF3426 domain-containing protein [Xanthomonas campestris]MEA0761839.1 DUF3426 domain-containing protein [Xanthomonas campestris pv. campestris]MEB1223093.1 DUF3426 domain-containing protein [Xanthomonas campestris pv. campestris]MEB1243701.1 DUF3426 domain-containing protein [Xanthomonas campestris pv. campestris]MEB1252710.1 DUF3426 domain-containing protein [Xanthomonas campestris pv. campestris]MEB1293774.1 DUF3426 domain-containing protein [Xanthomonas campestris pv. campestris]